MNSRVNGNKEAEAAAGRALEEVEAELSQAVDALQILKGERDAIPAAVMLATAAHDSWKLAALEARSQSLRGQLDEGQARLWLLQAERARLLLPAAEAQAAAAQAVYERAHAEYMRAHELTNRLGVEANNAKVRALGLRQTAEENERKAQALGGRSAARPS